MERHISRRLDDGQGRQPSGSTLRAVFAATVLSALAALLPSAALAARLSLTVIGVDQAGNQTPVTNYRWTVEVDATKPSIPGVAANLTNYSYGFHTSYMPVVAAGKVVAGVPMLGHEPTDPDPTRVYMDFPDLDPAQRYYVSVLPDQDGPANGYQMGAAPVAPGQTTVTVHVNKLPLPTAQLSVFVFEDNQPINDAPDLPEEQGLAGFSVDPDRGRRHLRHVGRPGDAGRLRQPARHHVQPVPRRATPAAHRPSRRSAPASSRPTPTGTRCFQNLFPAKYTIQSVPPAGRTGTRPRPSRARRASTPGSSRTSRRSSRSSALPATTSSSASSTRMNDATVLNGGSTITGRIVNIHNSRPPDYTFYTGDPVPKCWVGLNDRRTGAAAASSPRPATRRQPASRSPTCRPARTSSSVWDETLDVIFDLEQRHGRLRAAACGRSHRRAGLQLVRQARGRSLLRRQRERLP